MARSPEEKKIADERLGPKALDYFMRFSLLFVNAAPMMLVSHFTILSPLRPLPFLFLGTLSPLPHSCGNGFPARYTAETLSPRYDMTFSSGSDSTDPAHQNIVVVIQLMRADYNAFQNIDEYIFNAIRLYGGDFSDGYVGKSQQPYR